MTANHDYSLLMFITECICVSEMAVTKEASIRIMADKANSIFKGVARTPELVAEVKSIIKSVAFS